MENDDSSYKDSDGHIYYSDCEPSDELFYAFAKIEYGDTIEYYDCYVPEKETRYGRRKLKITLPLTMYIFINRCYSIIINVEFTKKDILDENY